VARGPIGCRLLSVSVRPSQLPIANAGYAPATSCSCYQVALLPLHSDISIYYNDISIYYNDILVLTNLMKVYL
jgi:hypothetical protein